MNRIHRIAASTTVNALAAELYDVVDPRTSATDASKLAGAAEALRDLNPSLPADESPVTPIAVPWIWSPLLPRMPFRVAAAPSDLRDALAGIGIRRVDVLARLTVPWLVDALGGSFTTAAVSRLRNLARLCRLSGMDRASAIFLHDHATTPLTTVEDVAAASRTLLHALVNEHVAAGFPAALQEGKPWNVWPGQARRLTASRAGARSSPAPVPYPASQAVAESKRWAAETASLQRDAAGRTSAESLAWLFGMQASYLSFNEAVRRGAGATAMARAERLNALLGEAAVDRGIVAAGSEEATGPSVETVLTLMGELIDEMEPDDAASARGRLAAGSATTVTGDGIGAFALDDLQPTHQTTVSAALATHRARALGPRGERALTKALLERDLSSLGAAFTQGIGTPTAAARPADLAATDREQWVQNARSASNETLQAAESVAWSAAVAASDLRSMRASVGDALDSGGQTPLASEVLKSTVVAQYGTDLTGSMSPFDRFMSYTPARHRTMPTRRVPINANYAERFRKDVLKPNVIAADSRNWTLTVEDFADAARFAFAFGLIYCRQLPYALASAARSCRKDTEALALGAMAQVPSSSLDAALDSPFDDRLATAFVEVENCSMMMPSTEMDEEALVELLAGYNRAGDRKYQDGKYTAAYGYYKAVLENANALANPTGLAPNTSIDPDVLTQQFDEMMADVGDLATTSPTTLRSNLALMWSTTSVSEEIQGMLEYMIIWETQERNNTELTEEMLTWLNTGYYNRTRLVQFYGSFSSFSMPPVEPGAASSQAPMSLTSDAPNGMAAAGSIGVLSADGGTMVGSIYYTDAVAAQVLHAATYIAQLEAGLNWLGFDPDTTPVWRFDTMLDKSRYFCAKADELQQRSLSVLTQAEDALSQERTAAQAVEIAQAQETVADAQWQAAKAASDAARAAADAAESQYQRSTDDAVWAVAGAIAGVIAVAATGGAAAASAAASGLASIDQAADATAAADDAREVAQAQARAAAAQVAVASAQQALCALETDFAAENYAALIGQQTCSENLYTLFAYIQQVANSYLVMANRMAWLAERAYQWETRRTSTYVRMNYAPTTSELVPESFAKSYAGAAQMLGALDALEHARVTATRDRYQLLRMTVSLATLAPEQLILLQSKGACLIRVSQEWLDARYPGLFMHAVRRVEVEFDGLLPAEGVTGVIRASNNATVRVPASSEYISDWETVGVDWCYPRADYDYSGTTAAIPDYVMKPLQSVGFTQLLSEYRAARDGGVLSAPGNALDTFEHAAPTILWTLEIPSVGNAIDLSNITDIRLVLYFTAHFDPELAARQQAAWETHRPGRAAVFPAATAAPSALARFVATPDDTARRDVRVLALEIASDDLPANLQSRIIDQVAVAFRQAANQDVIFHLRCPYRVASATATDPTGEAAGPTVAFSANDDEDVTYVPHDGSPTQFLRGSQEGTHPGLDALVDALDANSLVPRDIVGGWSIKVVPEDNPDLLLLDDDGDAVSVTAGRVRLVGPGSGSGSTTATLTYPGGSWRHASVTLRFKMGGGTLAVRLRQTLAGANARVELGPAAGIAVHDSAGGSTTLAASGVAADTWTELRLDVYGSSVVVSLDGVEIGTATTAVTAAGTVQIEAAVPTASTLAVDVTDVRVTQLRYDGEELSTVVEDSFTGGVASWTNVGWTQSTTSHNLLDLSFLEDVVLKLDYTASYRFPS